MIERETAGIAGPDASGFVTFFRIKKVTTSDRDKFWCNISEEIRGLSEYQSKEKGSFKKKSKSV